MAGAKLQDDINNIPLADDDPQGKLSRHLIAQEIEVKALQ
jgi:hypothetical protein